MLSDEPAAAQINIINTWTTQGDQDRSMRLNLINMHSDATGCYADSSQKKYFQYGRSSPVATFEKGE